MSQKFIKYKNNNQKSDFYGKFYARAVYNRKPVSTDEIAQFIQDNSSVTSSDVKAVLDSLGSALNYFFRRGEKVYLKDIGTFKIGFSSIAADKEEDVTANSIYNPRVLFMPETTHVPDNTIKQKVSADGKKVNYTGYTTRKRMLDGIEFEETHDTKKVTA